MAAAGPQHLALTGARRNAQPLKGNVGKTTGGPGRTVLKGADKATYQEEYIGRDFDRATVGITAFAPVTCKIELYGRAQDSSIPILLETFTLTNEQSKAIMYEGPCFAFMGFKLVDTTGPLEGVSWYEHQ